MATFLLVHSPVVGPATWAWVAAELRDRGHHVIVPTLVEAARSGRWQACVDAAAEAAADIDVAVLAGHSGAGWLLPAIAERLPVRPFLVFVDAPLPPAHGTARLLPQDLLDSLRERARHGLLPPWSEWFGPGAMARLVADPERRAVVLTELPEVPLAYFDAEVALPPGWADRGGAYVLLSEVYGPEAAQAAARGWAVTELPGAHLDLVVRPAEIAAALLAVAERGCAPEEAAAPAPSPGVPSAGR